MKGPAQPSTDLPGTDWTAQVDHLVDAYPRDVLGLLLSINEAFGYLPRNVLVHIAAHTGVPVARLFGIASFYRTFRLQPRGVHALDVCQGTACHVAGSAGIMTYLESALQLDAGGTSADRLVTVDSVACVGCCSLAPVLRFDGTTKGRARMADLQALVARLQSGAEEASVE